MSELYNFLYDDVDKLTPSMLALTCNPFGNIIKDMSKINANPFIFNHEINPKFSITDQKSSGRCWLFASCNILRVMASNNSELSAAKDLEFSQTYLYFWDKLERYHRSLQYFLKIKDMPEIIQDRYLNNLYKEALGDGGQWDMAKELIKKYGIVPKQAMPDSFHSKSSAAMNKFLFQMLKKDFIILDSTNTTNIPDTIDDMMYKAYRVLIGFLGVPPKEFDFVFQSKEGVKTYEKLTPHKFLELTKFNPDDMVSIVHDPRKENEYNKYYQVEFLGNVKDMHVGWINMNIDRVKELTKKAIDNNIPVWFGCDVGAERDRESGIMDTNIYNYNELKIINADGYDINIDMTKEEKLKTLTSVPSHAMVINGYYSDNNSNVTRWKIENSWGKASGSDGHLLMTDRWFSEYVYQIVVPKSYLEQYELDALDNVHKVLPPWDPLGTLA